MKKVFIGFLSAFLFSSSAFAASFSDVSSGNKYRDAINYIADKGIVQGYSDGTYKPNAQINRAEFTKIIVEAKYPGSAAGQDCFGDVGTEWFASYVCFAKEQGIVAGNPDGTYRPGNNINTAEAYKIVLETFIQDPVYDESGNDWFDKYLEYAGANELNFTSRLNASHLVTRGEMAQMIGLVLQSLDIGVHQKAVLDLVNIERGKVGVAPLQYNTVLEKAAYLHAKDMSDRNFFSHVNPDGIDAQTRTKDYYDGRNWISYGVGENLWEWETPGTLNAEGLANEALHGEFGWMQSPEHKANILNPEFTELGVGYFKNSSGKVIYVQNFGGIVFP